MFLLDTNVISELRKVKSGKADKNVVLWANSTTSIELYTSAIAILELEIGVLQIERRDSIQGKLLRLWLESQVLPTFSGRILPIDTKTALQCAKLHVPNQQPDRDSLIAATALIHKLTVVTRNVKDFQATRVNILNPWEYLGT